MGADFQCIAAKYMGAPQSTGLALGTEEMIRNSAFIPSSATRVGGCGALAGRKKSTARRWWVPWRQSGAG